MRSNRQIQDLVGSYAGWMTMLGAVGFGPFYQLGHGLRGLGLIEEGPAAILTLAGVVGVLFLARYDRRTYGTVTQPGISQNGGALGLLGVFLLIPVLLVLWTGAGYGLRDLAATLGSAGAIGTAMVLPRRTLMWLLAAGSWFVMLYSVIWSAPPPVQASLHVLVSFITLSGLWIEHGRMVRRFEAIHA